MKNTIFKKFDELSKDIDDKELEINNYDGLSYLNKVINK